MAPLRRYLRISKYSVLECRIYLENPADTRWLLDSRDPVLPRIFDTIKPLVLPKLREENERARSKKKSNPVKDVIVEDDCEVAVFLRESGTRHSLLTRQKMFAEDSTTKKKKKGKTSRSRPRETGDLEEVGSSGTDNPVVLVESDDEEAREEGGEEGEGEEEEEGEEERNRHITLHDIPLANPSETENLPSTGTNPDEKKTEFKTQYEGFSIWGWILCLLVTRRKTQPTRRHDHQGADSNSAGMKGVSGQVLMEQWMSTQVQADPGDE